MRIVNLDAYPLGPCCVKDDLGQQCGFRGSAPIVANLPDCVAEGVEFELSGDFPEWSVSHAKASRSSKETRCH